MEGKEWFYGFSEADLEGYARKTLSEETRLAMDKAIPQHEDLKKELVFRIQRYRLQINPEGFIWLDQLKNQPKLTFASRLRKSAFAKMAFSATLLMAIFGAFWVYKTNVQTQEKRIAQRVTWVQQSLKEQTDRDVYGDNSSNGRLNQALTHYRNKEYEKAELLFMELLRAESEEDIMVYIAVCRLHTGKFKEARSILEAAKLEDLSEVQVAIRWYLSLALATDDKLEAQELAQKCLKEIPQGTRYHRHAASLLKNLNPKN